MKKGHFILIIGVLVVIDIGLLFYVSTLRKIIVRQPLSVASQDSSGLNRALIGHYMNFLENEDVRIDAGTVIKSGNNEDLTLRDLNLMGPVLVIRFTGYGCVSCIESFQSEIEILKETIGVSSSVKIIILTTVKSVADLNALGDRIGIECDLYKIEIGALPFTTEMDPYNITSLYYFVLDDSFSARHFYIPNTIVQNMSQNYFDFVKKRYFTQ
ncbi:MAG: hypothetical protein IH591_15935 [Bacteroidales bacterium]|nr:hypothetical protein [Bacteroidales bacterium]